MNEDDGESCVSHYKINARDFFVPTEVKMHQIPIKFLLFFDRQMLVCQ